MDRIGMALRRRHDGDRRRRIRRAERSHAPRRPLARGLEPPHRARGEAPRRRRSRARGWPRRVVPGRRRLRSVGLGLPRGQYLVFPPVTALVLTGSYLGSRPPTHAPGEREVNDAGEPFPVPLSSVRMLAPPTTDDSHAIPNIVALRLTHPRRLSVAVSRRTQR